MTTSTDSPTSLVATRWRRLSRRPRHLVCLAALIGVVTAACAQGGGGGGSGGAGADGPGNDRPAPASSTGDGAAVDDVAGASFTDAGAELAGAAVEAMPSYQLTATVDPDTGQVQGTVDADLPVGDVDTVNMRVFAGAVDPSTTVDQVTVDGEPAQFELQSSLLAITLDGEGSGDGDDRVTVHATFDYTVPETPEADPLGGLGSAYGEDALQPAEIGLLGYTTDVVTLGHWFPVWMPEGVNAEPSPDGFGDIGNFPAAVVQATVEVPDGWTLVSGGTRLAEDGNTVVEGAAGVRDLGMTLLDDPQTGEAQVGDTTVRVLTTDDGATVEEVVEEAEVSLQALNDNLGAYPWRELEVIATPLGSGVGGMEWPGMVWIESTIFQGGLPGLGDMGLDLSELEDMGLDLGGLGLDMGALGRTRTWTVAHEIGHQWWHAVVGNDSTTDPAVDEPLAQYAACIAFREGWADEADSVCDANMAGGYEQARMLGAEDTVAAQPSDQFDSSIQYGGVVYGKAPGVYDALAEELGEDAVIEALAGVVSDHAFEQISVDQLHETLAEHLGGDRAQVDEIWTRWMEEAHGDEDLGVTAGSGLGDLGGLDPEELTQILEDLGLG